MDACLPLSHRASREERNTEYAVSFVVPCYNVEQYVARCLDSIIVQRGALYEIVCVDDGSTDGTPAILRSYSEAHDNLRVVTKPNSGLADARNVGVQEAAGEFVTFVDSDDFIASRYLETLWDAHVREGADLVVTEGAPISERYIPRLQERWEETSGAPYAVISQSRIGTMLLSEQLPCSAWGKLVKRTVCLAYPFISGRYHEDVEITPHYYASAAKCAKTTQPLYGYVMRAGSITHVSVPTDKQIDDFVEAYAAMEATAVSLFGCSAESIAYHRMLSACRFHSLISNNRSGKSLELERGLISDAEKALKKVPRNELSSALRHRFLLMKRCPQLYDVLLLLYERMVKGRI